MPADNTVRTRGSFDFLRLGSNPRAKFTLLTKHEALIFDLDAPLSMV